MHHMIVSCAVTIWLLLAVQALGLTSAWLARQTHGCAWEGTCQRLFLACLGLVGLTALAGPAIGPCYCLSSGLSLAFMVVGAITDFGKTQALPH